MKLIPAGIKVHLAVGYTDMRKGLDGLAVLVEQVLEKDPFSGHMFVFRGRRADLIQGSVLGWQWSLPAGEAARRRSVRVAGGGRIRSERYDDGGAVRKNHLFAGSDGGGHRWAVVASLIAPAKLNDIEPYAYLRDVLERMANGHAASRLDELLPWNRSSLATSTFN
jgi:hypothetical protein